MRTREEIFAASEAANFDIRFVPEDKPERVELWKGEPPIFLCSEPMQSLHIEGEDGGPRRVPVCVVGPITMLAMAWHLRLTPEEIDASNYHPDLAYYLLEKYVHEKMDAAGMERVPLRRIYPDDPEWGRP